MWFSTDRTTERIMYYVKIMFHSVTNCIMQSLYWEADSRQASREIPHLLLNPKVHYRFHKSPPLFPVLCQLNLIHIFSLYFPTIRSNNILLCTHISFKWSYLFRLSYWNFVCTFHVPMRTTCSIHDTLLDFLTLIIFIEEYKQLNSLLCNFFPLHATSSILGANILSASCFHTLFVYLI